MHTFLHAHFGEIAIVMGILLVLGVWDCAIRLGALARQNALIWQQFEALKERAEKQETTMKGIEEKVRIVSSQLESSGSELHAMAAHFVPRLRTEWDVMEEHSFEEESAMGVDPESQYLEKLSAERKKSE
jgi:hypothetical protein